MKSFSVTKDLLEESIKELEADWDFPGIRYDTVMTDKVWKEFSQHPERRPYKSTINIPKGLENRYQFGLVTVKDALIVYEKTSDISQKETLRGLIATLLNTTLHIKYQIDSIRMSDKLTGRSDKDRDSGNVNPTPFALHRFDYAIQEYCRFSGKSYTHINNKIEKITNGIPSLLTEYYSTCDIEDEFRDDIRNILNILGRDQTEEYTDLQRAYEIWKDLIGIGLTLDKYLELNGFPEYEKTEILLQSYLAIEDDVEELEKHLADEFPLTYKKYKKDGYLDRYMLLKEEARVKKYPKKLKSEEEIVTMVNNAMTEVYKFLPITKINNPKYQIINAMHPYSTRRAFQSAVKNLKDETVSTIVMTPRVDDPNDYLSTFAHESTHALHKIILDLGEKSKVLEKGAPQKVTQPVMEAFSTLVDDLFSNEKYLPYKKKFNTGSFPNFRSLYSIKFQAWFGLTQLNFIKELVNRICQDKKDYLQETEMISISQVVDDKLFKWMNTGFKVEKGSLQALHLLYSYSPDDGLRYIKTYITEKKSVKKNSKGKTDSNSEKKDINMPEAFRKKYGKFWLDKKEARIILHWLLLETGRNQNIDSYTKFVMEADIQKYSDELKQIGVNVKDI